MTKKVNEVTNCTSSLPRLPIYFDTRNEWFKQHYTNFIPRIFSQETCITI